MAAIVFCGRFAFFLVFIVSALAIASAVPAHGFIFLVLFGSEYFGNFLAGAFVFLLCLRLDAGPELFHAFLAFLQDAVNLLLLFGGEVEFGLEALEITFPLVLVGRHGGRLLL